MKWVALETDRDGQSTCVDEVINHKGHREISASEENRGVVKGQEVLALKINDKFMSNEKNQHQKWGELHQPDKTLVCIHMIGPNFQVMLCLPQVLVEVPLAAESGVESGMVLHSCEETA